MATLVFSAIGTAIGGPLGGAIGALVGRQVDSAIIGAGSREGPRLRELGVTTSSYGSAMPRHFGRMRVPGTIIWATDLVEHKETKGGGKGKPSVTTFSYTASFAVALGSSPIASIGRIWADGNLLRGSSGDLKVGGAMRVHAGRGDQSVDPLLAAAEGNASCPAYRGVAYVVFENLQLGDFGNRIPALTFEVIAGPTSIHLADVLADAVDGVDAELPLTDIEGLSSEGPIADLLSQLNPVLPILCDVSGERLTIGELGGIEVNLRAPTAAVKGSNFAPQDGIARKRVPSVTNAPELLRYYDIDRDYQPGLQRSVGRPSDGQPASIELPVATTAIAARTMIEGVTLRSRWSRQIISWRTAEIDEDVRPGTPVRVPGQPGIWQVRDWEWSEAGIELTLWRCPPSPAASIEMTDGGRLLAPRDDLIGTTELVAFELPWDGSGSGDSRMVFVAASGSSPGWSGAGLFTDSGDGQLVALQATGRQRATIGTAESALAPSSPLHLDRHSSVVVSLVGADLDLADATVQQLANGANRALLGKEIIQFCSAVPLGSGRWRLSGLLRGRGGTEKAINEHTVGERFVLLDATILAIDPTMLPSHPGTEIVAIGIGDDAPVRSPIVGRGLTQRPLAPVHPRSSDQGSGKRFSWTRRSRAAWSWLDHVDVPLHEEAENYDIIVGTSSSPVAQWTTSVPYLELSNATISSLAASNPGAPITVRQRGSYSVSDPLLLTHLP